MQAEMIEDSITHGYAKNDDVRIHYATLGAGPLIVMIHGFPDFWYSWRYQMAALADRYQIAAMDLRGYNLSDKPRGGENYVMELLVRDVAAVVQSLGRERAIIVGHDWGGAIAWQFAMQMPAMTERLIVLNLPHLRGLARELAHNPQQRRNSQYAREFQQEAAHLKLSPERLSQMVADLATRERYVEAFRRSDIEAMLHYYKQNYPHPPYVEDQRPVVKIQAPVLLIHGLHDEFLLPAALNGTWEWVERELTLVTLPEAGHFVQHDASERVTRIIEQWLGLSLN